MIQLDYRNVSVDRVGANYGLSLEKAFAQYEEELASIVATLFANKDKSGAWTRWLSLGENKAFAEEVTAYGDSVKGRFDDMVVLGSGGSSLGGYALLRALRHPYWNQLSNEQRDGRPRYYFVENVDADQIRPMFDMLNPERTLFVVIS